MTIELLLHRDKKKDILMENMIIISPSEIQELGNKIQPVLDSVRGIGGPLRIGTEDVRGTQFVLYFWR